MNEGIEVKDPTFALEFNTNTAPRPDSNTSYNSYNQSYKRGKGRGTNITKVEVEDHTLNLNFPISFQINTIILQIGPLDQVLKGLLARFVESLVIWPWIATIEWIMNTKGNTILPNFQLWLLLQMQASLKISLG